MTALGVRTSWHTTFLALNAERILDLHVYPRDFVHHERYIRDSDVMIVDHFARVRSWPRGGNQAAFQLLLPC